MNPFTIFNIQATPQIDPDAVDECYKKLAAQHHPDQGGDKDQFEEINQAYQILTSPAKRLNAYLEAEGIEHDPRGTVGNELMDLFMQVANQVQSSEAFIRKKQAAQSALAKALLEPESMAIQSQISKLISQIEAAETQQLQLLDQSFTGPQLSQIARNLAFLEKWRAQLQQHFGALF